MKKRAFPTLIALMLILGLLGLSAATAGAETPEMGYLDVSGHVLHLGGWLPDAPAQALRPRGDDNAAVKKAIYDALCARQNEIDISSYQVLIDNIGTLYHEVLNDNPDLFYVNGGFDYSPSGSYVASLWPDYNSTYSETDVAAYRSTLQGIIGMVDQGWSDVEKALFLHDYLVTHCEYDQIYSRYTAYDALVVGSSVCQGYALAYGDLCRKCGISAAYVSSVVNNHAWNLVTIGGGNFYVDCTWDDPLGFYEGYCTHAHFLVSKSTLAQNHKGDDWVSNAVNVYANDPTSSSYDNAWWSNTRTAVPLIGHIGAYALNDDSSHIFLRNMSSGSVTTLSLPQSAVWPVWGSSGYTTWMDNFSSLAALNDTFYFTLPTEVWSLSPTGEMNFVYALSEEESAQGYIYGIVNDHGTLYYAVATEYDASANRHALALGPVTVECDGFTYLVLDDGTASIVGCALTGEVIIPSTLDGYTVTNLAAQLFLGENGITAVTVPATVTSFGEDPTDNDWDDVFAYCADLTRIDVDADNPSFCSVDGVLYSKNQSTLISYPCSRPGEVYHTQADRLCCTSFASCQALKFLFIDNSDCWWYTYPFNYDPDLTVFYIPGGNTAQKVAQEQENGHVQDGSEGNTWCWLVSAEELHFLPAALNTIKEEAFRGTDIRYLIAPKSCTLIQTGAFADSALCYLRVGAGTQVEEGALPNGAVIERQ